ncbi:hypothetical protein CSUI_009749, partial [Cystoisospora suis]
FLSRFFSLVFFRPLIVIYLPSHSSCLSTFILSLYSFFPCISRLSLYLV